MAWLTGWGFRKEITVQDTNIDGNETDFPVCVKLNADEDIGDETRADGYDIRFTQSDGDTLLKYERELWTGGAGSDSTAVFWVKSNLASSGGATIYVYYGKADAGDGEDPTNVWDANFIGVWHMNDETTSTILDSTSNNNDGTKKGANEPIETASGKIGNAQDFDASDDYIIKSTAIGISGSQNRTMSLWFNTPSSSDQYLTDWGVRTTGNRWGIRTELDVATRLIRLAIQDGFRMWEFPSYDDTNWHYFSVVLNGTTTEHLTAYGDGGALNIDSTSVETLNTTDQDFTLGRQLDASEYFNDKMDEVRISDTNRLAAWIKFEYHNMNEADNELTFGSEEQNVLSISVSECEPGWNRKWA